MVEPFWKSFQEGIRIEGERFGRSATVRAVYRFRPRIELIDRSPNIGVAFREPKELAALRAWRDAKPDEPPKGPTPRDFGVFYPGFFEAIWLYDPATDQMFDRQPLSGELANLLTLGERLEDIYASGEERAKKIRHLVDWLGEMPDLKRQVLTAKVRKVAERYDMRATAEALAAPRPPEPKGNRRDRDPLSSPKILSPNPF
jgi:hypothetical protein